MKISKIKIRNFRILKDIEIDLEDDLSLIIGKNNCGKTSILTCLNKFLEFSNNASLNFEDFNLDYQNNLVDGILGKKEWNQESKGIELYLCIQYNDSNNLSNISSLMLDLDPKNYTVVLKAEYTLDEDKFENMKKAIEDEFKKYRDNNSKQNENDNLIQNGNNDVIQNVDNDSNQNKNDKEKQDESKDTNKEKFIYTFLHSKHTRYFKLKYKALHYNVSQSEIDENNYKIINNKNDIRKIISIKSISARRDNVNKERDGTLSHLTSKYYDRVKEKNENGFIQDFENQLLKTDEELSIIYSHIFKDIIDKIKQFGGANVDDTLISITSTLGQQELLKDNTTVVYSAGNRELPESYNGLGYLNLISIIIQIETILSEFRRDNENAVPADINLFFIEEPEAHTHPQMQYIFIKNIKELLNAGKVNEDKIINLQTVITTHSSHIVSECDFNDIKYLKKDVEGTISKNLKDLEIEYKKEEDNDNKRFKFLKQYLTLNCAEIFFADKAILFEGDTERILLPAMMKKIDLNDSNSPILPLKAQNISLIEVGNYSHIYGKFLEFIGIKTLIITDIDSCKENISDNGNKTIKSVEVEEGTITSNGSLKKYFKKVIGEKNELEVLKNLSSSKKVLSLNNDEWENSVTGNVRIAYQINENIEETSYYPRSFEDAFIYCNKEFFKSNIKYMENNLKNKKKYCGKFDKQLDLAENVYDIANNCIESKASFAMDILLCSSENFENWNIPLYIKEGLEWLKK